MIYLPPDSNTESPQMPEFNAELFEQGAHKEETTFWYAHNFMRLLGYATWDAFKQVVNQAISSCANLEIDIADNFIPCTCEEDGKQQKSYKLSRFACLLITMHADSKKEEVAQAKAVLAAGADQLIQAQIDSPDVLRLEIRHRLKESETNMAAAAIDAGVERTQLGIFKDAGFRGMYNMSLQQLKQHKAMPENGKTLYDFMGNTELAGNLFRVTQTAERIKSQNIQGLNAASRTAGEVGREVRQMMIKNSGTAPEDLKLEQNVSQVKKALKGANRQMLRHDKKK